MGDVPAPRAGRREWVGLAVLGLPTILVSMDIGVLFLALPRLTADLGATSIQQLWIIDIYGFMIAGFLVTMGNLGDRIGRRRLLLIGAAAFGAMSLLAAYARGADVLIVARALLGVTAATLMPSTLALISSMFRDAGQRDRAIALWMSCMMTGAALGPVVGGLLLQHFWPGSVFLIGVPVAVLLLIAGPMLLPEYRNPRAGRLDLVSVALSLAAILPIIYGFKEIVVHGVVAPLAAVAVGCGCGVAFVRRQLRLADPLLDLRLFRNHAFAATLAGILLGAGLMSGTFLLVSQYVQIVLDQSPSAAGLWLAPTGIAMAAGSLLAPTLGRLVRPAVAIAIGLVVSVAGFLVLAQVSTVGGLAVAVIGISMVDFGAGPLFTLGTGLIVGSAPRAYAGAAASMSETSNNLGSTLGLSVLGTFAIAVYRARMAGYVPAGATAPAIGTARDTLAGATVTARGLPRASANALLHTAGSAFTTGLGIAALAGAVVFAGLLALVLITWRDKRKSASTWPGTPTGDSAFLEEAA